MVEIKLSDLALANEEALAGGEESEVVCNVKSGKCWMSDFSKPYEMCGEFFYQPCMRTDNTESYCYQPC